MTGKSPELAVADTSNRRPRTRRNWTEAELELLRTRYNGHNKAELCRELNRSHASITNAIARMRLVYKQSHKQDIDHAVRYGICYCHRDKPVPLPQCTVPHFWIDLPDGRRIDLRLQMRWGDEDIVPHGIFKPTDYPQIEYADRGGLELQRLDRIERHRLWKGDRGLEFDAVFMRIRDELLIEVIGRVQVDSIQTLRRFIEAILPVRTEQYHRRGGPSAEDYQRLDEYIDTICGQTDQLLGGASPGMPGKIAGQLVDALAIASFADDGMVHGYRSQQIWQWIELLGEG